MKSFNNYLRFFGIYLVYGIQGTYTPVKKEIENGLK